MARGGKNLVSARRRLVIGALTLILLGSAAAAYRFQGAFIPWIEGKSDSDAIEVSGNIEAHESILSFKTVQSRIVELPFDEGQRVTAGTVLARVEDSDYRQQVAIAEAALTAQMRQLDVAEQSVDATRRTVVSDEAYVALKHLEFDRAQTLLTKGAGTADVRDVAETALKQSRAALDRDKALEAAADKSVALGIANIDSAREALNLAKIVLGYTTLTAPYDGVILVRQAEVGEVVSPGAAIVTLADIAHVWLRAYINETDIGKIRRGEQAGVTTNSYPGKVYAGRNLLHLGVGGIHAEKRRNACRARDARLSNPHRHRQSVARTRPRTSRGREDTRAGAWRVVTASPAIEARNLIKQFRGAAAVSGVSLICAPGEVFGFVGPDGAGKTTIMRLLAAVMTPDEGSIAIEGLDAVADPESVRSRVSYMPQRFGLYEDLTVDENIEFFAELFGISPRDREERAARLLAASGMTPFRKRRAGQLSGGMKQKLGLTCSLIHTPRVLLLDEPTAGVDPVSRRDFWRILFGLRSEGVAIVVATSYLDEAERCTRLGLLREGRMLYCDAPSALKKLMPGEILGISSRQARRVHDLIKGRDGVKGAILMGDSVHVVVDSAARRMDELARSLAEDGISVDEIERIAPSIEDLFVSLLTDEEAK